MRRRSKRPRVVLDAEPPNHTVPKPAATASCTALRRMARRSTGRPVDGRGCDHDPGSSVSRRQRCSYPARRRRCRRFRADRPAKRNAPQGRPTRSAPSPIPLCRNGKGLADKRYFSETALLRYRSRMPVNSTYALTTHTVGSTHVRQRRQSTRHYRRPGYCCSSRRSRSAPAFCP